MPIFNFTATTIMNAFILNSILISFSVVFMTTLKSYEKSLNHTTMLYILDGLNSLFLIGMVLYYMINHTKTKHEKKRYVLITIGVFLTANITLTLLDQYGVKLEDNSASDKSSPLQIYILFLTTFFATLVIYCVMHFVFGFGGGMLANTTSSNNS